MDLSKTDDCEFVGQNKKPSYVANNHSDYSLVIASKRIGNSFQLS